MKHVISSPLSLIDALSQFYPESSKRTLENWIKYGRVFLDEKKVDKKNLALTPGQTLSLTPKERPSFKGIKYLYEDRWMVVIQKPSALLSVASENPEEPNALAFVREDFKTDAIFPVHRIDRECSGVLLFARGKSAQEKFDALFEAHDLEREYIAIVDGHLSQTQGTWKSYLLEKENYHVVTTGPNLGKLAITHFNVVRYSKKFTYLRLILETGRKHQIRVQADQAGHPILGDKRYGSLSNPMKRLALHALRLSFVHPFTKKKLSFYSPPPKAFLNLGFE